MEERRRLPSEIGSDTEDMCIKLIKYNSKYALDRVGQGVKPMKYPLVIPLDFFGFGCFT